MNINVKYKIGYRGGDLFPVTSNIIVDKGRFCFWSFNKYYKINILSAEIISIKINKGE